MLSRTLKQISLSLLILIIFQGGVLTASAKLFGKDSAKENTGNASIEEVNEEAPQPKKEGMLNTDSDTKLALEHYNQGVEYFRLAQFHSDKGNQRGQKKLLKASLKEFETAIKLDSSLVEAQSNIGFVYLTNKKYKDALKAFNKALKINPNHLNTLNGMSTTYAFNGDIDESIKTFDELTLLDPNNAGFFFNKGAVLQKAGRFDSAKMAYEEAIEIDPKHQRSLFNLGTLMENQGHTEKALAFYQKAKSADVSSTIGLESINRIEYIEQTLAEKSSKDSKGSEEIEPEEKTAMESNEKTPLEKK